MAWSTRCETDTRTVRCYCNEARAKRKLRRFQINAAMTIAQGLSQVSRAIVLISKSALFIGIPQPRDLGRGGPASAVCDRGESRSRPALACHRCVSIAAALPAWSPRRLRHTNYWSTRCKLARSARASRRSLEIAKVAARLLHEDAGRPRPNRRSAAGTACRWQSG